MVPDAAEVLRGTIWNGLRLAPAVFSGRIILKRAMPERLRKLRHCIFTGGGVKVCNSDGICSAAFCESAALRQTFRLNCKVTGFARGSPFEERLPRSGESVTVGDGEGEEADREQRKKKKIPEAEASGNLLEVTTRFELVDEGFADPCLTTWPRHHI